MKRFLKTAISTLLIAALLLLPGCVSVSDLVSGIIGGDGSSAPASSAAESSASSKPDLPEPSSSSPASDPEPSGEAASSKTTELSSEPSASSSEASQAPESSEIASSEASSSSEAPSSSEPEPPKPLTLDEVVGVMRSEDFVYTDAYDNSFDNHFRIPEFLPDLPGAKAANDEIYDDYIDVFLDAEYAMKEKLSFPCGKLDFEAYLNGEIASVIIESFYDGGNYYYSVYNLDLKSGELLDNHGLARKLEMSYYELRDRLVAAMEENYNEKWYYPEMLPDADEQKEKTFTQENIESSLLYLGENGQLMAVYTAYMSVGASYHHTVIIVP